MNESVNLSSNLSNHTSSIEDGLTSIENDRADEAINKRIPQNKKTLIYKVFQMFHTRKSWFHHHEIEHKLNITQVQFSNTITHLKAYDIVIEVKTLSVLRPYTANKHTKGYPLTKRAKFYKIQT
jgi:hypothetical protein